VFTKTLIESLL